MRVHFLAILLLLAGVGAPAPLPAQAKEPHKLIMNLTRNDPDTMGQILNNIRNVTREFARAGESVLIEIVAYGEGTHMLRSDTSPVALQIEQIMFEYESVKFVGCGYSIAAMERHEGKKIPLIDGVEVAPSGVVYLIKRQELGYIYVKP